MCTNPLVSIIMGSYNAEQTINECFKSIEEQTYKNWEFIICDDCSTDNTYSILESLAEKESRIKLIRNDKNIKLAATLNRCLQIAQGKYIARMDADDKCDARRLSKQVEYLENHPDIDCVGTNRIVFDDEGNRTIRKSDEFPIAEHLLKGPPFAHPTIMTN